MEKKKPIGIVSGRLFCFFAAAIFFAVFASYLAREFWFDEVLTLQFASLPSISRIYSSYNIPNNQIVHTVCIHLLTGAGVPFELLRLFPLVCGILTVMLLWKNFSGYLGKIQLLTVLTALVLSPPFMIYASALRGYMLAALLVTAALCCGRKYAYAGKSRYLLCWFFLAMLATGVMPSALAGIAAAGLYVTPCCGKKFWKNRRFYFLALTPFLAFAVFYAPIWGDLLNAFELKEGWHNGFYALLAVMLTVGVTFLVPLGAGIFFHRPKISHWPRTLIWVLPVVSLFFPVAPFPRVWFVIFPVLVLLAAGFLRRMPEKYLPVAAASALAWGMLTLSAPVREVLSPAVSLAGQDDFYAPYFVSGTYTPSQTAGFIKQNFPEAKVFVSFGADPFGVWYYIPEVIPDIPPGKLKKLPDKALVILNTGENPEDFARRFNGQLDKISSNCLHNVYRFTKLEEL